MELSKGVFRVLVILALSTLAVGLLFVSSNTAMAKTPVLTITPTNLIASAVSPTQITLSWEAPTQNYGKTIVGYKIEQRLSTGAYNTIVQNTGNVFTTYSLTGLTTDTTYSFRVSAVYSDDTSTDPSNTASATPTATSSPAPTPPISSAITNVKFDFTPSDGTTLTATILTQYDYQLLQYKKDSRSIISNSVATTEIITNNIDGVLEYQNNHLSPPDIPGTLVAKGVSSTEIRLSWLHPIQNYGKRIMGYKIEWAKAPGDYVTIDDNTGNTTTSYFIVGLKPGISYTYRVSTIYFDQTSTNPSNEASATPLASVPPTQNTQTPPQSSTTPPPNTQPPTNPLPVNNVKFDFTPSDGTMLSGVILSQSEYQQFLIIKDPRSILSNVIQTNTTANNSLAALLKYQNIHTPVQSAPTLPPISNTTGPNQSVSDDTNSRLFYGVLTSVIAFGIIGIISWLVKTKITKKILKEYYFTLDKSSNGDMQQIRIRNSGPIIEDCIILCGNEICVWADTNLDKPRHVFEGSISTAKIPWGMKITNPVIAVKSGKKILKKIKLDEISHG